MFHKNIIDPFIQVAKEFEQRPAFCINGELFNYAYFVRRVGAILSSIQTNEDEYIGLIANDDVDTYASIFAIWLAGKAYVPINPSSPADRNQAIIKQVNIQTILDSHASIDLVSPELNAAITLIEHSSKKIKEQELAYIFFTSGSTGVPKGVMISKENVAGFTEAFWEMGFDINENDRCLQMFDLTFDLSVMSYLIPLLKGACVYTIPHGVVKFNYIFKLLDEHQLTLALMVPSVLNFLKPYFDEIEFPSLRYSLFCGEALPLSLAEGWARCVPNARIDNVYGPTEDTIFCTSYTFQRHGFNDEHNGILSIGQSMYNNQALVFDEHNVPVNGDEVGELCLSGIQLTPGYFNNPQLNDEMFFMANYQGVETRFYKTGDLCKVNKNGNISYVGRKDFQVKIQGFRVELSEIEFYAKQVLNNTVNVVALAISNSADNTEISLAIESDSFNIDTVMIHLKQKLPLYMIPSACIFVKPFPLNVNGKIDRKALMRLAAQQ